ncbi:MAG TPA: hypothetical protein VGO47_03900 [Chlamydiales bacterium]|jgi:hypothetical protein|nr:hypothetical protein [Chlamydiales bacterium]
MEQLQMLKYMLKRDRLDFTGFWKYEEEEADIDNEWQDRGVSVLNRDDKHPDRAFESLLDLLEMEEHVQIVSQNEQAEGDYEEFIFEDGGDDDWITDNYAL